MSNIMASIGLTQIKRINAFSSKRQVLAKLYDSLFMNCNNIDPLVRDYDSIVPHIYVVRIKGLKDKSKNIGHIVSSLKSLFTPSRDW